MKGINFEMIILKFSAEKGIITDNQNHFTQRMYFKDEIYSLASRSET